MSSFLSRRRNQPEDGQQRPGDDPGAPQEAVPGPGPDEKPDGDNSTLPVRSEERYQQMVEMVPGAMLVIDEAGRIVLVNETVEALFGYRRDELIVQPVEMLLPGQLRDLLVMHRAGFFAQPGTRPMGVGHDLIGRRKDGTEFPVEIGLSYTATDEGTLALAFVIDITERKQADQELAASELRYRRLFEAAQDGIMLLDARTGQVVDVNPFLLNLLGYSLEDLLGKELWEIGLFKDIASSQESFRELQGKGYVRYEDLPLETRDGQRIEVEFVSNVYWVNDEEVIQCNVRDITAHKRAEKLLVAERHLLRTLIDNMPDYIYIKDSHSRFILNNLAQVTVLGAASLEDTLGKTDFDFYPADEAERYFTDEQTIIQTGQPLLNVEEPGVDGATGRVRWTNTSKVPLRDRSGQITGIVGIGRDITDRKQAEAERLNAELLRTELNKEKEIVRLEEQFIMMVSHDFRTPLAVIQGKADLLGHYLERLSAEQRLKYLADIGGQIKYMVQMLDEVIMVARAHSGKLEAASGLVDIVSLCQDICEQFQSSDQVDHQFIVTFTGSLAGVYTDEHLLHRILFNLLSNATKYSPKGGDIRFEVSAEGQDVIFRISDQGIGIPQEDQKRLFEVFHRAQNTGNIQGTGLGLAIVKASVEALGGEITFESIEGKGTTFAVRVPKRV